MNAEAEDMISRLGLAPLPLEGGFYATIWVGPAAPGGRASGSAILFLITREGFSALHRLRTDEVWHFHAGDPAELSVIDPSAGTLSTRLLGPDPASGHLPQSVAPAGAWQGARIAPGPAGRGWTLLGCTLAPAWDPREFELGERGRLLQEFPAHAAAILALTR
jgi:predicted cupin superfamily sugar epimerase